MNSVKKIIIEKAIYGGYGLGYCEGKAVLVPYSVPGDELRVSISLQKRDFSFGNILEIINGSPMRIESQCPHFGICGGCSYLNIDYRSERDIKRNIIAEQLRRNAGIGREMMPPIDVISGERFHYRSCADIAVKSGKAGFYKRGSNEHVPIPTEGCLLIAKNMNEYLLSSTAVNNYRFAMDRHDVIIASHGNRRIVEEEIRGIIYRRDISCFFQSNRFLRDKMIDIAMAYADIEESDMVLDIACGIGFFTIPAGTLAREIEGFDIDKTSIRWARVNARNNNITNVRFHSLRASAIHPGRCDPDIIIIDPPREGISRKARNTILKMKPRRIIYISCDPATFSRDAGIFIQGGYSMKRLTLIDMFPCTYHIEIISQFESTS